jgi:hypothetical protein
MIYLSARDALTPYLTAKNKEDKGTEARSL